MNLARGYHVIIVEVEIDPTPSVWKCICRVYIFGNMYVIDLPGFSWFPDLISSRFLFFCEQENTTREYPAFHGLFNETPVGYCYTMVWRVQFVSPSTHHWDQIWNDQANWYCTTDCTRHGVSIELLVCKWSLGQCLLLSPSHSGWHWQIRPALCSLCWAQGLVSIIKALGQSITAL